MSVGRGEGLSARSSDPSSSSSPEDRSANSVSESRQLGRCIHQAQRGNSGAGHLRISSHDGVVAVVVGGGAFDVQGAGPVTLSKLPVVDIFPQDLLPVLEPVNLERGGE